MDAAHQEGPQGDKYIPAAFFLDEPGVCAVAVSTASCSISVPDESALTEANAHRRSCTLLDLLTKPSNACLAAMRCGVEVLARRTCCSAALLFVPSLLAWLKLPPELLHVYAFDAQAGLQPPRRKPTCCCIKIIIAFRLAAITISGSMWPPQLLRPGCLQSCDACSGRRTRSRVPWMTTSHQVPRLKHRRRQTSRLARAGRTTQSCGKQT